MLACGGNLFRCTTGLEPSITILNSKPPVFCYFKVHSLFQDKNQIRITLKDITLRVFSGERHHWQHLGHWLIQSLSEFKLMNSHT